MHNENGERFSNTRTQKHDKLRMKDDTIMLSTFCPRTGPFWTPIFHICAMLRLYISSFLLETQYFVCEAHARIPPWLMHSSAQFNITMTNFEISESYAFQ